MTTTVDDVSSSYNNKTLRRKAPVSSAAPSSSLRQHDLRPLYAIATRHHQEGQLQQAVQKFIAQNWPLDYSQSIDTIRAFLRAQSLEQQRQHGGSDTTNGNNNNNNNNNSKTSAGNSDDAVNDDVDDDNYRGEGDDDHQHIDLFLRQQIHCIIRRVKAATAKAAAKNNNNNNNDDDEENDDIESANGEDANDDNDHDGDEAFIVDDAADEVHRILDTMLDLTVVFPPVHKTGRPRINPLLGDHDTVFDAARITGAPETVIRNAQRKLKDYMAKAEAAKESKQQEQLRTLKRAFINRWLRVTQNKVYEEAQEKRKRKRSQQDEDYHDDEEEADVVDLE